MGPKKLYLKLVACIFITQHIISLLICKMSSNDDKKCGIGAL